MKPDETDDLMLAAYLDGELSPGETLDMERRLEAERGLFEVARQVESGQIPAYLVGNLPEMINWALTEVDQKLSDQLDEILGRAFVDLAAAEARVDEGAEPDLRQVARPVCGS